MRKLSKLFYSLVIGLILLQPVIVSAENPNVPACEGTGLSCKSIDKVIIEVIQYLAALLAGIFVLMVIVGAIMMMTVPGKQDDGKKIIQFAVIGAVIALLSYSIIAIIKIVLGVETEG